MRFLVSTENKILLFPDFGSFEKIFSLEIFSKIQPNTFSSLVKMKTKNNQTKHFLNFYFYKIIKREIRK